MHFCLVINESSSIKNPSHLNFQQGCHAQPQRTEFRDNSAHRLRARSHVPPKFGRQNSHIAQMV